MTKPQSTPEASRQMSLRDKADGMVRLASYPALSLMLFLRRDIGSRVLAPGVGIIALIIIMLSAFVRPQNRPKDLFIFGLIVLIEGCRQRYLRWQEFHQGVRQHSFYIGCSRFKNEHTPPFLSQKRRIERFVDYGVAFAVGTLLLHLSPALGAWIMFAAVCLGVLETAVHLKLTSDQLDMVDGLVKSEVQSDAVDRFAEADSVAGQLGGQALPTGIGADIAGHLERQNSRQTPPTGFAIPRSSPLQDTPPTVEARLARAKNFFENGLLSQAEYDAKRHQILAEL